MSVQAVQNNVGQQFLDSFGGGIIEIAMPCWAQLLPLSRWVASTSCWRDGGTRAVQYRAATVLGATGCAGLAARRIVHILGRTLIWIWARSASLRLLQIGRAGTGMLLIAVAVIHPGCMGIGDGKALIVDGAFGLIGLEPLATLIAWRAPARQ